MRTLVLVLLIGLSTSLPAAGRQPPGGQTTASDLAQLQPAAQLAANLVSPAPTAPDLAQSGPETSSDSRSWWQKHLWQTSLPIGALLAASLLLAWSCLLLMKVRHKSRQLETSLATTGQLLEKLDQQRREAELYLEMSGTLVIGLDRQGRVNLANRQACELLGYAQEELIGRDWFDCCIPPEDREWLERIFTSILNSSSYEFSTLDSRVVCRNGECRSIQWHNTVKQEAGQVIGTLSSGIDVTPRIQALSELSTSRERFKTLYTQFESLLHGISEPLLIIDREQRILWANDAAKSDPVFRSAVDQGKPCGVIELCRQLCNSDCIIAGCFRDNRKLQQDYYLPSGRSFKVRVFPASNRDGQPQTVILMAQDVTEVLKVRTEMARASQLANVGELAANVAHEINNPLHGIINYADIIKSKADDPEFTRTIVTRIANEGERISRIVRNLLDYTRRKDDKPGPVTLMTVIESANMLLGHKLKMGQIVVDYDIPNDLPLLKARSSQLQQVFVNLLGNAHDALMEKTSSGTGQRRILLRARTREDLVEVCCEDNGNGIPAAQLERVCESFYTTKPIGKGTGLGLSISKSIIEEHGGRLRIESSEGQWTRVHFTIPRFLQSDVAQPTG